MIFIFFITCKLFLWWTNNSSNFYFGFIVFLGAVTLLSLYVLRANEFHQTKESIGERQQRLVPIEDWFSSIGGRLLRFLLLTAILFMSLKKTDSRITFKSSLKVLLLGFERWFTRESTDDSSQPMVVLQESSWLADLRLRLRFALKELPKEKDDRSPMVISLVFWRPLVWFDRFLSMGSTSW